SQRRSDPDLSHEQKRILEREAATHLHLAREWNDLLQKARSIPGFDSFLRPPPCSSILQHLPTSGPVVVIIVDERRCDALVLLHDRDEPLQIPLPKFTREKAHLYQDQWTRQLTSRSSRMREANTESRDELLALE